MSDGTQLVYVGPDGVDAPLAGLPGQLDVVSSPAAVTALLEDRDPTVVVTEYDLAGRETGLDVLSRVRRTDPDLPVVLCTAAPDGEVASAATRLGVTEYVPQNSEDVNTLAERVAPYLERERPQPVADGNPGTEAAGGMPGDPTGGPVGTSKRERELERLNRRLDLALESIDVGVFVWDAGTNEIRWDERTAVLFGRERRRHTLDMATFFEYVHPEDREPVRTDWERTVAGGADCETEYRVVADDQLRWLATHGELVTDENGNPDRLVGITRDVTERHDREADIREARQRTQNILERIDDGFLAIDDDWNFTYVNADAEALLDVSADAVLGENVWDCFPEAVERAFYDEYDAAMRTQEPTSFEEYVPPLDTWFSVSVYPSPDGLSVFFEDLTERKQRQQDLERYETIMETIDDGVYALDDEGRFTFVNDALADLTGHDVSDLLGRHVSIIKGEQTVKLGEEVLGQMLSEGIEQTTFEFDLEHASGEQIPFEDRMTLLPFEDGAFTGTAGVFRDISQHKRRETLLTSLMETTRELMHAPTTAAVADLVVEATTDVLGFELNTVRLYDGETGTLEPVAMTDGTAERLGERPVYDADEGGPGAVFQRGERAYASDLDGIDGDATANIYLPLGEHGVLSIGAAETDDFDEIDEQVAEILATNARAALDRAERQEELTRYETIMETVQHMVFVLDEDGRFTMVSGPLAARLGIDRETLLGEPACSFLCTDECARFDEAIGTLRANPDQSSELLETEIGASDGERFPAAVEVSLLPGDEFTGSVGVVQELTELEQTRERLRDERDRFSYLFDNIPDAVVDTTLVDGEPVVQSTNPAFADVFGYSAAEVVGDPIGDHVLCHSGEQAVDLVEGQAERADIEQVEVKRRTADGDRYFLFRGIPYRVGDSLRAFGIYTDITEQKHRQRQLEVLNRVLRHNIRNDLTVLLGHVDQLASELDDDDHLDLLDTVDRKAEDIVSMSETVRNIERTIGRTVTDHSQPLDETVRSVVAACRREFPDAEFTVEVPDGLAVRADDQLHTALRNLVENAVEHNDAATPTVRIVATTAVETPTSVTIRVVDNGPGIPENERLVVGDDEPITQLTHASGLGLWLVRWIVDSFGGTLSFEVEPTGTAVSMTLSVTDA